MLSYWERQSFLHYDHIVAGAGIVGLSVAIELKERYPNARVLVLERGLLPTGASSRNAGFGCMGSLTELIDDSRHQTEEQIVALYALRKKGLELLRKRLGDEAIGYEANGSYELISENEIGALDKLERFNKLLQPVTGQPAFRLANEQIERFGFSHHHTKALVENTCEGSIHTGKMLRALTDLAIAKGAELKTGAMIERFEEERDHVYVYVQDTVRKETIRLQCNTFNICTNAFTKLLLPGEDVVPGRGQVLITNPVEGLKFKGIFHFNKGYYYFREIDGRVLLGGGRNLNFEAETTTELSVTELIQNDLERKLREIIMPGVSFTVDQRWSGIMAFGSTKNPIVKRFSDRVYGAFRMGGMGVAIGSEAAKQLVSLHN
jgi:gamma-glutamylputrescine oxidase